MHAEESPARVQNNVSHIRGQKALILVILVAAVEVSFSWNPDVFGQATAALSVIVVLAHGRLAYGWTNTLAFLLIALTVSLGLENIGTATGLPYGRYHFVVTAGLPNVGLIPLIVGLLWSTMGYFSWHVAAALLDDADARLQSRGNVVALPLVAAFVMTQWDFVMDRGNSTIAGAWVWHDGGADFGVPLLNYAGWFVTSWTFFQLYALFLARRHVSAPETSVRFAAVVFYAAAGLAHLVPVLFQTKGTVTDATGHVWSVADIREMSAVIMVFTMFFSSLLAAIKLAQTAQVRITSDDDVADRGDRSEARLPSLHSVQHFWKRAEGSSP